LRIVPGFLFQSAIGNPDNDYDDDNDDDWDERRAGVGYKTLALGTGYLKNFDPAASDPQKGMTAADVSAAEADAKAVIDGALGDVYDEATWATGVPPVIASIAERLGAAYLIRALYNRDGRGDLKLAEKLVAEANAMIQQLRKAAAEPGALGMARRLGQTDGPRVK